ncbi:inositol monophosphatase family protein [Nocardioides limicola]|uniref:inositol monophosphatase family protein n=1 Tax=Nocardioides limicola TaxID=2803368 RepID=UPI0027DE1F38|nr:inositol monophosphatase family protein [Nocardioides sp. DJM-14]
MTRPAELRDIAARVALEAAELVRERRSSPVLVAATKSTDVDVVTEADRASEQLIRELLRATRPTDAVLGEEEGDSRGSSGVRWIVDPIDGTVNFLYDIPEYAVSIAAEVDGTVLAGAVVNAATGTLWSAAAGEGAHRDGEPIRVAEPAPVGRRLIATGFGYDPDVRARQGAAVAALLPQIRDIRRMGSCALDLCHVADGTLDGYVEEGTHLWDHAAGLVIAAEAGARSRKWPTPGGRTLLACAPDAGFDEFVDALTRAGFTP